MTKFRMITAIVGLLGLLALPAVAMHHEVKVAEKAEMGKYLTDAEGMTLYWFAKDTPGHSACTGGCVDNWPVFFRENVAPPDGVTADEFAPLTREDGTMQTTFRGYPLYYFKGDSTAGDTNGDGKMGLWHVVDPGHFPAE